MSAETPSDAELQRLQRHKDDLLNRHLQRRKDDLLSAARAAERQLDNVNEALKALGAKELRALGLPTIQRNDLVDANVALRDARRGLRVIQAIAEKHDAA